MSSRPVPELNQSRQQPVSTIEHRLRQPRFLLPKSNPHADAEHSVRPLTEFRPSGRPEGQGIQPCQDGIDALLSLHYQSADGFDNTFVAGSSDERCDSATCCAGDCSPFTVTCTDEHCQQPNWCQDLHDSTCNDIDCGEPPCQDTSCPESYSHFDTCFQSDCAPSTWPGNYQSAPCASGDCGGTFATDTCSDLSHRGWDPNCPNATLRPQGILHDYNNHLHAWNNHAFSPNPSALAAPADRLDSLNNQESFEFLSPTLLQKPTFPPSSGLDTLPPPGPFDALGQPAVTNNPRSLSPPRKRKRLEDAPRDSSKAVASVTSSTPTISETESIENRENANSLVCLWVVNASAPSSEHQQCLFQASSPTELHEHVTRCHTRQLTNKASFVCCWAGCERFKTQHFGQKSKLERHLQTHDGYMPFECEICGKRFITKDQRRNHQATHLNLQAWVCAECGKSFNAPTSLKTHMNIHTGRKPHHCWMCGHRDGDSSNFSKHMKAKHPGEPKKRPDGFVEERDWLSVKGYVREKERLSLEERPRSGTERGDRVARAGRRRARRSSGSAGDNSESEVGSVGG